MTRAYITKKEWDEISRNHDEAMARLESRMLMEIDHIYNAIYDDLTKKIFPRVRTKNKRKRVR